MKRRVAAGILAIFLASALAPAAAKVTLKFAFWGNNAEETRKNVEILQRFEKRTGIGVTPLITTWGTQNEKMITMAAAGAAPDLFWLQYITAVPQFANSRIAADLSPFVKRDKGLDTSDLFSVALKMGQYKGSQYALLRDICDWQFAYNKELIGKAGLTSPKPTWTMDDFITYGKKLTLDADGNGKPEQFGAANYSWDTAIYQFGGELWERDGKKTKLGDPAVTGGLRWFLDLSTKYHILPRAGESGAFDARKAAFGLCGPWSWGPYAATLKFKWDIINLPVGPTGKSVSQLLGQPIVMNSRSKHPKEAYQLIKYLCTDPEAQMMQASLGIAMPTLKKLAYSDAFAKAAATPDGVRYYLDSLEDTYIQPQFAREATAKQMLTEALEPVWAGRKTIEQALTPARATLDAFLGRK